MSKLKRQIELLEYKIRCDDVYLDHESKLLRKRLIESKILPVALAGAFITGFLVSRKRTLPQLGLFLLSTGVWFNKMYLTANLISSLKAKQIEKNKGE